MRSLLTIGQAALIVVGLAMGGDMFAQGRGGSAAQGQKQPPRQGSPGVTKREQPPPGPGSTIRTHQMDRLRTMTEESTRIRTRAEELAQAFGRPQARVEDRTQLRLMQEMATAVGAAAREHERLARGLHDMIQERDRLQDQDRDRDRQMDRDMDRIREHLHSMTGSMSETLKLMERMSDRLRVAAPAK